VTIVLSKRPSMTTDMTRVRVYRAVPIGVSNRARAAGIAREAGISNAIVRRHLDALWGDRAIRGIQDPEKHQAMTFWRDEEAEQARLPTPAQVLAMERVRDDDHIRQGRDGLYFDAMGRVRGDVIRRVVDRGWARSEETPGHVLNLTPVGELALLRVLAASPPPSERSSE
jgi:hypothetical protein